MMGGGSRRHLGAATIGAVFLLCAIQAMNARAHDSVTELVSDHLKRYPRSEARDIYKLLYQTFHGAGHAVGDAEEARRWLYDEWGRVEPVEPDDENPILEPIFIEGRTPPLYRLNLGPTKASGVDPDTILGEFLRTAEQFPRAFPEEDDDLHVAFIEAWAEVGRAIKLGEIPVDLDDYAAVSAKMRAAGWPPAHHSDVYANEYRPHYRLIMDPAIVIPPTD